MANGTHPLTGDELRPYEQQQGAYWLYGPDCDVFGNGKVWVPVARPSYDAIGEESLSALRNLEWCVATTDLRLR